MEIISANIKSNPLMRQSYVQSDVKRIGAFGVSHGLVVLWQEIQPRRYKDAIRRLFTVGWRHSAMSTEIPLTLDEKYWQVLASGVILVHRGKALASPNRYISWVVARCRDTGEVVVFINTHFVSGAWNKKPKAFKGWRQRMWMHHFKVMQTVIERFVAAGYTVIGGGDFNRIRVPMFHIRQKWLNKHGIDYLFVVPAKHGMQIKVIHATEIHNMHTDHAPVTARCSNGQSRGYLKPGKVPNFSDLAA